MSRRLPSPIQALLHSLPLHTGDTVSIVHFRTRHQVKQHRHIHHCTPVEYNCEQCERKGIYYVSPRHRRSATQQRYAVTWQMLNRHHYCDYRKIEP